MLGSSRVAAQLAASQEGLSSMSDDDDDDHDITQFLIFYNFSVLICSIYDCQYCHPPYIIVNMDPYLT
jgi:hypothetical protein